MVFNKHLPLFPTFNFPNNSGTLYQEQMINTWDDGFHQILLFKVNDHSDDDETYDLYQNTIDKAIHEYQTKYHDLLETKEYLTLSIGKTDTTTLITISYTA